MFKFPGPYGLVERQHYGSIHHKTYQSFFEKKVLDTFGYSNIEMKSNHNCGTSSIDADPSGRYILSGKFDGGFCIHDVKLEGDNLYAKIAAQKMRGKINNKSMITGVQWCPLEIDSFTTSDHSGTLKIWDTKTMTIKEQYKFNRPVDGFQMSPHASSEKLIAVTNKHAVPKILDRNLDTICRLKDPDLKHIKGGFIGGACVRWNPVYENMLAVSKSQANIHLYDIRNPNTYMSSLNYNQAPRYRNVHDYRREVTSLAFTTDGLHLLSYGKDGEVRLWDPCLAKQIPVKYPNIPQSVFNQYHQMCVIKNPDVLFLPMDSQVNILEIYTGSLFGTLTAYHANCCVYTPKTNNLYTGGLERFVTCWTPCPAVPRYEPDPTDSESEM